jgi:hypothetical protein
MNQEDFKRLLNEALEPIKQTLDHHTELLDQHTKLLNRHTDIIENQLLPSVLETENTLKSYGDMYRLNDDNIRKVEKRVQTLEDNASPSCS